MMSADRPYLGLDYAGLRPLVIILGPTGVGKTEISLELAEKLSAEIVSADSRLLYIGMDIGTAKPTPAERIRVPHHMIDVTTPDQNWSLAQYQSAVNQVIDSIHQRGHLPLLVGGTGQYIHAVTQGWKIPSAIPDPDLRQALETWAGQIGHHALHDRLARLDPLAAEAIDPSNLRRTIRALEVIFSTGQLFSSQRERNASPYSILQLGISRPREELYRRIDNRIQAMLAAGFIAEVQLLLEQGYSPNLPTLTAIGYREIAAYLDGQISLEDAVTLLKRRTRIFVRRQANWFKPDNPEIHWFSVSKGIVAQIEQAIYSWIASISTTNIPKDGNLCHNYV
jgi:tRNA dimethylallyltransferase